MSTGNCICDILFFWSIIKYNNEGGGCRGKDKVDCRNKLQCSGVSGERKLLECLQFAHQIIETIKKTLQIFILIQCWLISAFPHCQPLGCMSTSICVSVRNSNILWYIITARQRSYWKVLFSQASVGHSVRGGAAGEYLWYVQDGYVWDGVDMSRGRWVLTPPPDNGT